MRDIAHRRWMGCAVSTAALLVALALVEGAATAWARLRLAAAPEEPALALYIRPHPELGWAPVPGRDLPVSGGGRFTTGPRGFRRFEADAGRPLVVLGDSITHAAGVPDGAVYYDVLARRLDLPVVALGVQGYGTLQELLLARREAARLPHRPAAVILQMTANDVINNSYPLERASWVNNNLLSRPYLADDGTVVVRDPRRLHEHLTVGRALTRRWLSGRLPTVEDAIESGEAEALALYRRELDASAAALARLRSAFPGIPALAFAAGGFGGRIGGDLERLAAEAGFAPVELEPELTERAGGRSTVQADGVHWNALGHELAGRIVARAFTLTTEDAATPPP